MALVQIGFLGWIIAGRAAILRDGREIVLKVEPVDPRDLLRGDYVRLGYEISRIPVSLITNLPPEAVSRAPSARSMCACKKGGDGLLASGPRPSTRRWTPRPARTRPTSRASSRQGWDFRAGTSVDVDYGIERFYVPEGEGHGDPGRHARAAVRHPRRARRGRHAADQGALDGDRAYEEPLY